MEYGKLTERVKVDSKTDVEAEYVYREGEGKLIRRRYERRIQVHDKRDEISEYLKFTDNIDKFRFEIKDICFKIEYPKDANKNGDYYVIECWTELDSGKKLL